MDKENSVADSRTIVKRKDNETGYLESATTTASLSPIESMTVDISTQTKAETTSDESSTTYSPISSASFSVSISTLNSTKGATIGTSDSLASISPFTPLLAANHPLTLPATMKNPSSISKTHATHDVSVSPSTLTYTSIRTLPNGSLSSIKPVTVVRVTPTGSSAGSLARSTIGKATITTKHSTQKGAGLLTTADLTREVIIVIGGAALAAIAL